MTTILAAAGDQMPEDVGKAGPLGLLLIVLLLIATALLVRSMSGHLRKLPRSFDPADQEPAIQVPDDISELDRPRPQPGQELLDTLRRAPLAIEPPRRDGDDRTGGPAERG
ncbi:hypothetical protein DQ244_02795 [Blastococcus sp. TBT05-19]|uniref:hypothetical protein n=1 Tax=Blastococcus sp. TBT05-19 TaxID=2250581 RepID=UPI000DE9C25B|nr:hypothetical protein [Blastococcus sp. TBT05-19]RBY94279.1 hypothetical protein DQ244_02795 [Blastococcus sp. TBT05-19]